MDRGRTDRDATERYTDVLAPRGYVFRQRKLDDVDANLCIYIVMVTWF